MKREEGRKVSSKSGNLVMLALRTLLMGKNRRRFVLDVEISKPRVGVVVNSGHGEKKRGKLVPGGRRSISLSFSTN